MKICETRLKGRIDCAGHGKSTLIRSPHLPRASSKRNDREIERRHRFFTSSRTDLLSHWTFENCPKLSSGGHFQSEQAFTPPTHFRTLFGFSEKFGNCRSPLTSSSKSDSTDSLVHDCTPTSTAAGSRSFWVGSRMTFSFQYGLLVHPKWGCFRCRYRTSSWRLSWRRWK